MERMALIQRVFADIVQTSHRMEYIVGRELRKDGLTVKEWEVIAAIETLPRWPRIGEVAEVLSTSHQNVRRIADQLARKGFMEIVPDPQDGRAQRLVLTDRNREYWERREEEHARGMEEMFSGMTDEDLVRLAASLGRLAGLMGERYREVRGSE